MFKNSGGRVPVRPCEHLKLVLGVRIGAEYFTLLDPRSVVKAFVQLISPKEIR